MLDQELNEEWQKIKEMWKNSSQTKRINFEMSKLLNELKGKMSQFEKDAIRKDSAKITASISQFSASISQFEKDSISRDLKMITAATSQFEKDSISKDLKMITAAIKRFLKLLGINK